MKTIRSLVVLTAALFGWNAAVCAQSAASSSVTTNNASGVMPYSLYGGVRENINLATGNLNVQLPLVSLPGRAGHDLNVGLTYDSKNWNLAYHLDEFGNNWYEWYSEARPTAVSLGWRINAPFISSTERCTNGSTKYVYETDFIVTLPDGSRHRFKNKDNTYRRPHGCDDAYQQVAYPSLNVPITDSVDGSFMRLDTSPGDHAILRMKDGTRIIFYGATFLFTAPSSAKVIDPNGNTITYTFSSGQLSSVADTLGRSVSFGYTSGRLSQLSYKDSVGTLRIISFAYQTVNIAPTFSQPPGAAAPWPSNAYLLSSITLPNNRTYTFTHNNFGELTKITYPTGGYTRYTYGAYLAWHQLYLGSTTGDFRELVARYVCPSEAGTCSQEDQTSYTPTIQGTWSNNSTAVVIDAGGNKTSHTFTYVVNAPNIGTGDGIAGPRELTRQVYEGTTTLLRTIQTDYAGINDEKFPIRVTTTLETGQVSKVEWDYGTYTRNGSQWTVDNVIEQREFDYGDVSKRKTKFTYLKVNPVNGQNYDSTPIFILNRKTKQEVYDWNGSTETLKAKTEWEYDSYTEGLTASGTVQHDSAFSTGHTTRGNVTATLVWRDNPAATLTTRNQFDDAGNFRKATDPLGHFTTFSYTDSWANTACQPSGGSAKAYFTSVTNAMGHVTTSTYNSCSGTVASTTDPNSQTTTFSYDLMNRLTQTNLPDGGQTSRIYNEGSVPLSVTITAKINASTNLVTTLVVDGLGREVQSRLDSDPQGVTYTVTTYDALGRKATVTNPYRSTGDPTYGVTTYQYDALGRVTKVIPPDGTSGSNNVTTTYSGNGTTATDQQGRQRRSFTDALGRLIQVDEPNPTLSTPAITSYTYDALDNLTQVIQSGSRQRTFTYNSLSQLLTAANPESGTITYTYDNDGNLITKTDARGISATHAYDTLHRLTGKTYSDGTPAQTLVYDVSYVNGVSVSNPVGRLVKAETTAPTGTINSYDATGRVTTQYQWTPAHAAYAYVLSYTYSLIGGANTYTNGVGVTFTQTFNSAARITQVTSSLVDAQHPATLASAISYNPVGAVAQTTYGNGIVSTASYNNRFQPVQMANGSALTFNYSWVDGGGKNNGNVMSWSASGSLSFNRSFTYDELNRLKTMSSPGEACTGLTWTYDIWANRTNQTGTGGICNEHHPTILTNNRITELGYDVAGNVTSNATTTYQYDAEGRLKSINNGSAASYVYDAFGRRVQKNAGTTTVYLYDLADSVVAETDGAVWHVGYVYVNGKYAAEYRNGTTYFVHQDHLGSSRVLTNVSAGVLESISYLPYGEGPTGNETAKHLFTGKERDAESGLDYFGARYYASLQGRFISTDPPFIDQHPGSPQSWNLYAYARNNPLKFTDPTGNAVDPPTGGIGMVPGVHHGALVGMVNWASSSGTTWANVAEAGSATQDGAVPQTVDQPATTSDTVLDIAQLVVSGLGFIPGLGDVADGVNAAISAGRGNTGEALGDVAAAASGPLGNFAAVGNRFRKLAKIFNKAGNALRIVDEAKVFRSFGELKRVLGPAGDGMDWHHIVEQCRCVKFGSDGIQNTENVVALMRGLHHKLNGFYSSKQDFAGGRTVRDWLGTQSYDKQRAFGIKVLEDAINGRLP